MTFRINVKVVLEREDGKPATRKELEQLIEQAIKDADPGTIEAEGEGRYDVEEWEVETWNPEIVRTHIMTGEDYDAFLVERRGVELEYLALDNTLSVVWVPDANDALHFCRRSDAYRMVDNAPDAWDIHITDHRWMGGVPRDRVVPYAEEEQ